jgi:hypothetical protein
VVLKADYARRYRETVFYSELIINNYLFATPIAFYIYKKLASGKEKNGYIANMLKYPLSLKEIIQIKTHQNKIKGKYIHLSSKFISIQSNVRLKIFMLRVFRKLESKLKMWE